MEEQMPAPYSLDLRKRVLKDRDNGMSSEDVAKKYSVARATVDSWRQQQRETGSIAPKKHRGGPKIKLAPYEKEVRQLVADHPDATLEELHAQLPNKDKVTVVTLHNFLHRLKITWKKKRFVPPNDTGKMSSKNEKSGKDSKTSLTLHDSFSSTRHGPKPT
jgi:transposase